jgi:IS30 family transposase
MSQKKYLGLSKDERSEIEILRNKGYGIREIARALKRSPNTISYELKTNKVSGEYVGRKANDKARLNRRSRRYQNYKIEQNKALRNYVIAGLKAHWNPDEISGAMKETKQPFYVSKSQIYEWLYSAYGQPYCQYLYAKRYRPKKRKPVTKKTMIPNRVPLSKRPKGATNRSRYGHWEGDTMVSSKRSGSKAALGVFVERKVRFGAAQLVPNLRPDGFAQTANVNLQNKLALSMSLDNGIENKDHEDMVLPAYFCEPYSSYQKGSVENFNKMLRRYMPKGTDFATVTQNQVDYYLSIINNKPRKILGYKSALQLANEKGILRK